METTQEWTGGFRKPERWNSVPVTETPIPFIAHHLTLPEATAPVVSGFDADLAAAITNGLITLNRARSIQTARPAHQTKEN